MKAIIECLDPRGVVLFYLDVPKPDDLRMIKALQRNLLPTGQITLLKFLFCYLALSTETWFILTFRKAERNVTLL